MNIFIPNKKNVINDIFVFFILALIVRLLFLFFQQPSYEKLVEDELLYWDNANMFLEKGFLTESIKAERMPGIFIYSKILLILSIKNLKIYLTIQSIIDAFTCIIIYKTGSMLFPKEKLYICLSAILSPLMIILSSQVLSETIFLFLFTIFLYFSLKVIIEKNYLYLKIASAGLFLGLCTSIRSITYPLIFLSILPFVLILIKKNIFNYKILACCIIFLFFSLLPISSRIYNNVKFHESYALTSQAGTHLAYWVTPMILSETKNIDRETAIKLINKVASKYTFTDDIYAADKILRKVGLEVLSDVNKADIIFHWIKSALINLSAPSILLDKNIRALSHPSYYEIGNIILWVKSIISNPKYYEYLFAISIASISSLFTIISLIVGMHHIFKNQREIFYITTLYILYFLIITGPILSPKYIFPILPCIFLYQGITLYKIVNFIKRYIK